MSIPKAVRLLLRHHKNRWDQETPLVSRNRAATSSSSDSVSERSDELATRKLGQESLRSIKKDENDPLADALLWLEDFKENLKPTEVHAPAHISQNSDSAHSMKVATKSRMHSIFTHFPEDRNCDVCLRTKITKASCSRRTSEALPPAEKFGNLITADRTVLNEGCTSRDNHRCAVEVQDLATQRILSYPSKTNTSQETEKMPIKILGTVASTDSCICRQLIGIWESM